VLQAYEHAFAGYPLARFSCLDGLSAQAQAQALSLKRVAGSARTHIHFQTAGDKLFVFSLIDNLVKGAAGQAVENFNRLQDFPVGTGLTELEGLS
jgi:N-acetyl-gamma-glutamyl-phosphate reductase